MPGIMNKVRRWFRLRNIARAAGTRAIVSHDYKSHGRKSTAEYHNLKSRRAQAILDRVGKDPLVGVKPSMADRSHEIGKALRSKVKHMKARRIAAGERVHHAL